MEKGGWDGCGIVAREGIKFHQGEPMGHNRRTSSQQWNLRSADCPKTPGGGGVGWVSGLITQANPAANTNFLMIAAVVGGESNQKCTRATEKYAGGERKKSS